jgi:hypothetical protein
VIVDDLDVVRIAILPSKTDTPLVIHSYAVLTCSVSNQPLQAVARRATQVFERFSRADNSQFSQHDPQQLSREPADGLSLEESFGITVGEAPDHST